MSKSTREINILYLGILREAYDMVIDSESSSIININGIDRVVYSITFCERVPPEAIDHILSVNYSQIIEHETCVVDNKYVFKYYLRKYCKGER